MKRIPLTQGKFAIVDDEDLPALSAYRWFYLDTGYAARHGGFGRRRVRMHRQILATPEGLETDHINGDRLDNRRANLRIATPANNQHNKGIQRNNTSGLKGVSFHKASGKFRATVCFNRKHYHLGVFDSKEGAYAAYCAKAIALHGEFARTA